MRIFHSTFFRTTSYHLSDLLRNSAPKILPVDNNIKLELSLQYSVPLWFYSQCLCNVDIFICFDKHIYCISNHLWVSPRAILNCEMVVCQQNTMITTPMVAWGGVCWSVAQGFWHKFWCKCKTLKIGVLLLLVGCIWLFVLPSAM